jgi:hypothetical protein
MRIGFGFFHRSNEQYGRSSIPFFLNPWTVYFWPPEFEDE